jgi:hypothetical protein
MATDFSGRVALFWRTGRKMALRVFDASLAPLSPVLFDEPVRGRTTSQAVAFAEDGRILTVWLAPLGVNGDSILGRIWRVR